MQYGEEDSPAMNEMILAYQGEMALKGQNRKTFEAALLRNLRKRTEKLGSWAARAAQSTIYLEPLDEAAAGNIDEAFLAVRRTFGVANVSRCAVCPKDFGEILRTAAEYLKNELAAAKTFKVAAKRSDKGYPLNSMEISRQAGGWLLTQYPHLQVDVQNPDLLLTIEVREKAAYIHAGKQKGAGGLPIPTSGRAAVMLSGGIDSPVAAWLMAKRGLGLVAVHFASPPYTSARAAAKVEQLGEILAGWTGPLPYFEVPYTKTQEYLRDGLSRQNYFTVLMRRSMMRITREICEKEACEAMITGESLAQVASQTLPALHCTNSAQDLPVLRPLVGTDKTEITDLARKIGTFETSILPYEDCCTIFTPPHPKTRPRLADVLRLEQALPELAQLEQTAAKNARFVLLGV